MLPLLVWEASPWVSLRSGGGGYSLTPLGRGIFFAFGKNGGRGGGRGGALIVGQLGSHGSEEDELPETATGLKPLVLRVRPNHGRSEGGVISTGIALPLSTGALSSAMITRATGGRSFAVISKGSTGINDPRGNNSCSSFNEGKSDDTSGIPAVQPTFF